MKSSENLNKIFDQYLNSFKVKMGKGVCKYLTWESFICWDGFEYIS